MTLPQGLHNAGGTRARADAQTGNEMFDHAFG
jgi:hypothetical protein